MCERIRRKLRDWLLREPKEPVNKLCLLRDGSGYLDTRGFARKWPDGPMQNAMWAMWMSLSNHLRRVVEGEDMNDELKELYAVLRQHENSISKLRLLPPCDD